MKRILLTVLMLSGVIVALNLDETTGWEYDASTQQAFYMFANIEVDSFDVEAADVLGAFKDGQCIGFTNAIPSSEGGYTTLPLMGLDGLIFGLTGGQVPDEILLYDTSNGSTLSLIPSGALPGFANNEIYIIDGTSTADNTFGCTDVGACNYNAEATADNESCWSNVDGCDCSDGEGAALDCAGACNGDSTIDMCETCDDDDGNDCEQDCNGEWGGSLENDICDVCDGDGSSCLGCMADYADNYDSSATWDDGSQCEYTVPGVVNFQAEDGSAKVLLTWEAPEQMGNENYTYLIFNDSDEHVATTNYLSYSIQVEGVDENEDGLFDEESCFNVVASNTYGDSDPSSSECANGFVVEGCYAWGIQLSAEINGWGQFIETDTYNKLGAGDSNTWGYDNGCDIYEPQHGEGNFVSLYFPHEEWDAWGGDNFTMDMVYNDPDFFNHNLTTWDAVVESNMSGVTSVTFDFFGDDLAYLNSLPVHVLLDGEYISVSSGQSIEFTLYASEANAKEFTVIIGNRVPQAPVLSVDGGDRKMDLNWSAAEGDLYPAESFHIYRDGFPDHYEDDADSYEFFSDHYGEASGCGLFHSSSDTSVVDDADLYGGIEMLLYESEYTYIATARNAAGESSEGHLVRTSGGIETFHAGRYDEDSDTTNPNNNPESIIVHAGVTESDDGNTTPDGDYTIPHNHNDDANSITVSLDGSGSTDADAGYNYSLGDGSDWSFNWSSQTNSDNVSGETSSAADGISFDVINEYGPASEAETHTYQLEVTTEYPTKSDISVCEAYSVTTESYSHTSSIDVVVHPEPNKGPVAVVNNGLDLIVAGDGLSVSTSDEYDFIDGEGNDFNDYDAGDQVWFEPHNNSVDTNAAHLTFTAIGASDEDGECDAVDGTDCDDLEYDWSLTTGALAGFNYEDSNGNGQFDWGEYYVVEDGDYIYEDADLGDWTAIGPESVSVDSGATGYHDINLDLDLLSPEDDVYILTMKVTDEYGYSDDVSLVVGVHDERNDGPTVGSLRQQPTYYISYDSDVRSIEIGGDDIDGYLCVADSLNADDSDNDDLTYKWDYSYDDGDDDPDTEGVALDWSATSYASSYTHINGQDPGNWNSIAEDLAEGDHTFTFIATDPYAAADTSSTTISVRGEPNAAPASVGVTHTDLKYVTLEVNEGSLISLGEDACYGQVYSGDLDNTEKIELLNGTAVIKTWTKDVDTWSDGTGELGHLAWIDKHLDAETAYGYSVKSYNSDLELGGSDDSSSGSATTGNRPTVTVINPNGAEIMSVDDDLDNNNFDVEFSTTDAQYISKINVFYSDGTTEVVGTLDGASVVSDAGVNEDGEAAGDTTTTSFTINVKSNVDNDNGIGNSGFNYNAGVRVQVWDVGDYDGLNVKSNEDISDSPFTMVSDRVEHTFLDGWNMFGSPLVPDYNIMDDAMVSLGTFGAEWLVFDADGAYEDLYLTNGEGYYLALNGDRTMYIDGEALTGDPEDGAQATYGLDEGWNLIANPLVNLLDKEELNISFDGDTLSWTDAVQAGWVAQTINGWFGNSHTPYDQLLPFGGYWINTSRAVDLHFTSHLLDDGTLARNNNFPLALTINAKDKAGDVSGDYIVLGISEESDNQFSFGEDEYDIPNPGTPSFINLRIDNIDWIGQEDRNGNTVNNPYFLKDMKSINFEYYQSWNISAEVDADVEIIVELSWDASEIDYDLHLVMRNETVNMKEVNSIEVSSLENMTVVLGDIDMYNNPLPEEFALSAAYPNPFNPSTNLNLDLNQDGFVSVKVYNVVGQVVAELVNGYMDAGYHTFTWNAGSIASGMYLVRVEAGAHIATQKLMLLK